MKLEIEVPDSILNTIPQKEAQEIIDMCMKMFFPLIEKFAFRLEEEKPK